MTSSVSRSALIRWSIVVGLLGGVAIFFVFGLGHGLSLPALKAHRQALDSYGRRHPVLLAGDFIVIYVVSTALSMPVAEILTVAAGALFGLVEGVFLASFAASIGSTLAFCASRYVFRDVLRRRWGARLQVIDANMRHGAAAYLFIMRLIPAIPFFVVNLLMGVTEMPVRTFYWVSQLGMLPATLIYVNAGTALATLHTLSDILSLRLLGSLLLLGVAPLLVRWVRVRTQATSSP